MVHITQTHRHQEQITGRNTTKLKNNPGVVIHSISENKTVWHNKEIQTSPRNCQIRRIGCICGSPLPQNNGNLP